MQLHRIKYWLNANPEDELVFDQTVTTLCDLYRAAPTLTKQGEHIMGTDEMTSGSFGLRPAKTVLYNRLW